MNGKKKRSKIWLVTLLVLLFAVATAVLAWAQLKSYESGVMEIYAEQQDGYVQLVLDQINLNKNRSNDEIIRDILGTLDESSNRYWTLSQKDALVFVKDVMETSRYRGFSTKTYFQSESARQFVDALQTDQVLHRTIQVGQRRFVASGVQFEYRGENMRICLLTNADVVLDQNAYLSAKINVCLLAIIELCVLALTAIGLTALSQKWRHAYLKESAQTAELRGTIEELNGILSRKELYDTRLMAFQSTVLPQLFQKIEARQAWPVHFTLLECDSAEDQDRFLSNTRLVLDRRVFRIILDDRQILLLTANAESLMDQTLLTALREPGVRLGGTLMVNSRPAESLETVYRKFYQDREKTYGTQVVS